MSSPPTCPIDVRPCIPVCQAGQYLALGVRETLIQAHHLDDLALPLPPAHDALLRTLTAITAELTGLDDPDLPLEGLAHTPQRTAHQRPRPDCKEEARIIRIPAVAAQVCGRARPPPVSGFGVDGNIPAGGGSRAEIAASAAWSNVNCCPLARDGRFVEFFGSR
ncbi:hypothetical protein [Streptomyces chartreusis]|uniref:hypothetical protein n=1 Tax=Streptomyces chartreusis TaxID=1969 RepID=UPI00363536EA